MDKVLRISLLIIAWLVLPPVFIYLIAGNKNLENRSKMWSYFSVIISPFTLLLLFLTSLTIVFHQPSKFSITTLEKTLNIHVHSDYNVEGNTIKYLGQDYTAIVVLKFSNEALNEIMRQIEDSRFFNLQHNFYGANEDAFEKSDTNLYWKVRKYLENEHLTGYWIKSDEYSYQFYSPNLSDIPNSAILFHEDYDIEATLSLKNKTLIYKYIKY